jgi:hypothetical protein
MQQRVALTLFFLTLFCLLAPASYSYSQDKKQSPQEYGIKAIFLYNFLQFVHWPVEKCPLLEGKLKEIAVLGDSPIGESLQVLKDELQKTQGTKITVRFLGPYEDGMKLSGCRLLFITQSEMKNIKKILAGIKDEPVLTVSDTEECLEQGCMIALISRMNKVRWGVNRQSAEQAGLRLSSRLLAMAVKIVD